MSKYCRMMDGQVLPEGARWTHPVTGEVYGGTDYDNPEKLSEMGAEPCDAPAVPTPPPPTKDEQKANRAMAYRAESDPLLAAALSYEDEGRMEDADAKRAEHREKKAEIRAMYPYPND